MDSRSILVLKKRGGEKKCKLHYQPYLQMCLLSFFLLILYVVSFHGTTELAFPLDMNTLLRKFE